MPVDPGTDGGTVTFDDRSPIDGARLATVAAGTADDIDRAATTALDAFPSGRQGHRLIHPRHLDKVAGYRTVAERSGSTSSPPAARRCPSSP